MIVGYALNFDVKHVPLMLYDQSQTPESRAFLQEFRHTEFFDVAGEAADGRSAL